MPLPSEMPPQGKVIAHLFGVPLVWNGWSSLPLAELLAWLGLAWWAGRRSPRRTLPERLGIGLLSVPFLLGWEWLHNIAHAAASKFAGKPMDGLLILLGMPNCIYSLQNHRSTSPRQHVTRALGGPAFNTAAMVITRLLRRLTPPGSLAREMLDLSVSMNTFLAGASLLPLPGIDGGPILKWSLVEKGKSTRDADAILRKVDLAISPALGGLALAWFRRRRWISGALAAFFAIVALAVGKSWMSGESREV